MITSNEYERSLKKYFLSKFGNRKFDEVSPQNFASLDNIEKFKEEARNNALTETELASLGKALNDAACHGILKADGKRTPLNPYIASALWLYPLTGCRKNEILTMKWENVDLKKNILHLPDAKGGKADISLSDEAVEVICNTPRIEGNPYVIVGGKEGRHIVSLKRTWGAILEMAGIGHKRIHDLRDTFGTHAAMQGLNAFQIQALMRHKQTLRRLKVILILQRI